MGVTAGSSRQYFAGGSVGAIACAEVTRARSVKSGTHLASGASRGVSQACERKSSGGEDPAPRLGSDTACNRRRRRHADAVVVTRMLAGEPSEGTSMTPNNLDEQLTKYLTDA